MATIDNKILDTLDEVKADITDIKVTMARNTESLEHHVQRTDELQEMVVPVYKEYLASKAIKEYKEDRRKDLLYRLKFPGAILSLLAASISVLAWLLRSK